MATLLAQSSVDNGSSAHGLHGPEVVRYVLSEVWVHQALIWMKQRHLESQHGFRTVSRSCNSCNVHVCFFDMAAGGDCWPTGQASQSASVSRVAQLTLASPVAAV